MNQSQGTAAGGEGDGPRAIQALPFFTASQQYHLVTRCSQGPAPHLPASLGTDLAVARETHCQGPTCTSAASPRTPPTRTSSISAKSMVRSSLQRRSWTRRPTGVRATALSTLSLQHLLLPLFTSCKARGSRHKWLAKRNKIRRTSTLPTCPTR